MPTPALVDPTDVVNFPGAPFNGDVLTAAVAEVRGAARWHIAPQITETLTVDTDGELYLFLPSLHVDSVSEVRLLSWDSTIAPVVIADWRLDASGYLTARYGRWAAGRYEVDVVHGFETCPEDLLPIIANVARDITSGTRLASLTQGPFSESYRDDTTSRPPALVRVTLPPRF